MLGWGGGVPTQSSTAARLSPPPSRPQRGDCSALRRIGAVRRVALGAPPAQPPSPPEQHGRKRRRDEGESVVWDPPWAGRHTRQQGKVLRSRCLVRRSGGVLGAVRARALAFRIARRVRAVEPQPA